ncbi:DUF3667 domain-containing protein [Aliikangiella coralliicola]|uniref:DUF3667 domain-containing protein n=1 Tax=Aliikangiella coralliicola TaxID=2592383 RepID=A0A545UEH3_9GAMM|nr:DUF3667 domain-containing protein [Aliikangiella coralliicola]TQV87872.1 DUF3667 domain-containing protein [Aliikangiella coralliicola]
MSDTDSEQLIVSSIQPNKELSKSLVDSPDSETGEDQVCSNCGTRLAGRFCHECGQSSRSMIKFFGELVRELTVDVIGFDSRLKHTIAPLIFKPGKITIDYIYGKRFFYVLPLRLYLFTSLLFILFLKFNTDPSTVIKTSEKEAEVIEEVSESIKNIELPEETVIPGSDPISPPENQFVANKKNSDETEGKVTDKTPAKDNIKKESENFGIQINGENISFQGEEFKQDGFLKDFADNVTLKWESWKKDPSPLIKEIYELLPYMMFILLPIFAVVLKVFYLFSKRFYVEHLIFLIHNHCFIYVAIMLQMSLWLVEEQFKNSSHWLLESIASLSAFIAMVLGFWILIYILLAMKKVYRQGWPLTLLKSGVLGTIYILLITVGFITTILVSAYFA